MAIYSVGRKRVILALLLTTALLLTLDLRGNPVIDAMRDGFSRVMSPVQSATTVVTNPIERVWHGIANYDDLQAENQALQEQVDRLIGTQAAAEAAVIEGKELQALYNLPSLSGIDTEVARVVGSTPNNLDQVIEIDKGRTSGIAIGMPVVNQAGLVGKVTQVNDNSARVMLVTDSRYSVAVKVMSSAEGQIDEAPADTTPSGMTPEELEAAGTTTTTTTAPPVPTTPSGLPVTGTTLPGTDPNGPLINPDTGEPFTEEELLVLQELQAQGSLPEGSVPEGSVPEGSVPETSVPDTTTTTTLAPIIEKEYGALEGRGRLLLPQVRFLQDNPSLAELQVETAGGSESLAPPGIPVGRVANRADRAGSRGPVLDVEPHADLARLNFVRVVLYKPLSEVGD
jgi:rod shape-determining protein MreC